MLLQNLRMEIDIRSVVVFVTLATTCSGCSCLPQTSEHSRAVHVSPDGNWIAYLWGEKRKIPSGPEWVTTQQTAYICWAPAANPEQVERRKVAQWGRDREDVLLDEIHLVFSAEGGCLAVVYPSGLLLGNLEAGTWRRLDLENEAITSLRWLDGQHIGYVTLARKEDGSVERMFWHQQIDQSLAERTVIHHDVEVRYYVPSMLYKADAREFWSPDGQHVFFCDAVDDESLRLMAVATRQIRTLASQGELKTVSWARDSSRLAWTTLTRSDWGYHMFVLEMGKTGPLNLSQEFQGVFRDWNPSFEPLWTPDSQFIVANCLETGGCLIQPQPWTVRMIGKILVPNAEYPPLVRGQAVTDVLITEWMGGEAAVDYEGKVIKRFPSDGCVGWTVLPKSRQAVCISEGNKVNVVSLNKKSPGGIGQSAETTCLDGLPLTKDREGKKGLDERGSGRVR